MKTMRIKRHKRVYAEPFVQLIDLESVAPLLANSVDQLEGDTGPEGAPGGIGLEDFGDGGEIIIP